MELVGGHRSANQKLVSIYRIRDVKAIASALLKLLIYPPCIFIGLVLLASARTTNVLPVTRMDLLLGFVSATRMDLLLGIILVSIVTIILLFFRLRAVWKGVVVDVAQGTMTYPGGGVALNSFVDIFRPKYVFQYFTRFQTELDQIRMIDAPDVTDEGGLFQRWADSIARNFHERSPDTIGPYRGKSSRARYYLDFNGSFGAVSLQLSRAKRDELYSFIRQYDRMGVPVVSG